MRIPIAICDECGTMTALTDERIRTQAADMVTGDPIGQCAIHRISTCIDEPCEGDILFAGWMDIYDGAGA